MWFSDLLEAIPEELQLFVGRSLKLPDITYLFARFVILRDGRLITYFLSQTETHHSTLYNLTSSVCRYDDAESNL